MYTDKQLELLSDLLDKYEKSPSFTGKNLVVQKFWVRPTLLMITYDSDYANLDQVRDFELQMKDLEREGLIEIRWKARTIERLIAVNDRLEDYYQILGRRNRHEYNLAQVKMYQSYLGRDRVVDQFCLDHIQRLEENRKTLFELEEAEHVIQFLLFIRNNQSDILEREMSISVLGDTKLWEKQYRTRVCSLLKKYGDYQMLMPSIPLQDASDDRREEDRIILEEHRIYANPSYVYMKGNAEYHFEDGTVWRGSLHAPIAFSTETLSRIRMIRILDGRVMTVENLTAFNRMGEDGTFFLFLSGYHNSPKQRLIRRIYDENPGLTWVHFGDIDPDGYYILEHLRRGTGIDVQPVYMSVEMLEKYKAYAKKLTENDRKKAENLLSEGKYPEVMSYMLEHGVKLEQEIISWMEKWD